ncbi:nitronate monooxygenase [Pusillimonas sp. DMV24BSW_D]|uniref:NAD(P)H-dependent flavin oxidoreductase n=1 Tax=Neopusillimonas aestuarii TaxID=2716226 RepID=UPI00140C62DE|nr:nitronate monooxygenase [Pusillimonas sp. DMV24BSW_D]QIM47908.1 nitronate monooxygenase [Pusillimonas sp. DMV24BSW_D]
MEINHNFRAVIENGRLPVMIAPMFLVSGPDMVVAAGKAGVLGAFPAPNARNIDVLDDWMSKTEQAAQGKHWALNMIVHRSYERFFKELELVERYRPSIVSTALGSPRRVLDAVHGYGGIVMADVTTPTFARKAIDAGADVLVLVTNGAGGHTGFYHPFALVDEIRKFWSGPLGLAGAVSRGKDIRAAQMLGADFVVMGTRFLATKESLSSVAYREMLVDSSLEDLVASKAVSGVMANWLKRSLEAQGGFLDEPQAQAAEINFAGDISVAPKAWKDVWSAGHGVGAITKVQSVAEVVDQLYDEYQLCLRDESIALASLLGERRA